EPEIWNRLLIAVHRYASLKYLSMQAFPHPVPMRSEFRNLAGNLLSLPSLKYAAVSTATVHASVAFSCPALKELDMRTVALDSSALTMRPQTIRPMLNALCLGSFLVPPSRLQNLFNLTSLERLVVSHNARVFHYPQGISVFQLMDMTSGTLRHLSMWVHGIVGEGDFLSINSHFPTLQTFTLFFNRGGSEIDQDWSECNLLVSTMVSISGPQFRELYLYLHSCSPSIILTGTESSIPHFPSQIMKLRFYSWCSDEPPPRVVEAERMLKRRLGMGRELLIFWSVKWTTITHFGLPQEQG
ncbi:hypothetical protein DL96DRAFT_1609902, partial [Flagelloscypha sp. PMI_526]